MILAKSLVVVGALGLALAAPAKASAPTSLHLTARTTQARQFSSHPLLGDAQIGSGVLIDRQQRRVGTFAFQCIWAGSGREQCSGWGSFGNGQLVVGGMSRRDSNRHTWAVVGGTGGYRGARGDVRITDIDGRTSALDVELVAAG
jgi:hypothetical protein